MTVRAPEFTSETGVPSAAGWTNAMSAVAVAKGVFVDRKIGLDQLPPASPAFLPLD